MASLCLESFNYVKHDVLYCFNEESIAHMLRCVLARFILSLNVSVSISNALFRYFNATFSLFVLQSQLLRLEIDDSLFVIAAEIVQG